MKTAYKFSDGIFPSIARNPIRITTPDGALIPLQVDLVYPNIPFLIGLEALEKFLFVSDNVENLFSKGHGCTTPIIRKHGHL